MSSLKLLPSSLSSRPQLDRFYHAVPFPNGSEKVQNAGLPVCTMDDFEFRDGPLEPTRPKFIRSPYPPLLEAERSSSSETSSKRRGRPFRKATPLQAVAGAVIGGGWSVVAFKATLNAYEHLQNHPPAHDLPLGLTSEVNQLMLTMLAGFGGLAVCMFGVSSLGLALLSVKLISASKVPTKIQ